MCGGREIQHTPEYNSRAVRLRCATCARPKTPRRPPSGGPRGKSVCVRTQQAIPRQTVAREGKQHHSSTRSAGRGANASLQCMMTLRMGRK
jgi:hypothetical protein